MTARRKANLLALAGLAVAALLRCFPPELYSFYPGCLIHRYLHLYCPGCGSTRAMAALLHGRLIEAVHYNPLFVAATPLLLALAAAMYWSATVKNEVKWPQVPRPALTLLLAMTAVFTIARNL